MVKVAILGFGVVGSGVAEVLSGNGAGIQKKADELIEVKYILDVRDFPDSPFAQHFVKDFSVIEHDPEVNVVVETIGGVGAALDFTERALKQGKSVVTSNKELVATHGRRLLDLAAQNNAVYLFEASVGGGIPIIRPLNSSLTADEITEITGILNGTTNYILTKMSYGGTDFDTALKDAQAKGYAERNPAADVEGADACRKICILASLAFGRHVYPEQVHTEGITNISLADVEYAEQWGGVVKLIGRVKQMESGKLQIIVCPMFIPRESQLANVDDVFNGIMVRGDSTGDVVFYGKGAGKLPTASAVVADVIDCVKHFKARKYLFWGEGSPDYVEDYLDDKVSMYVRAHTDNEALALGNANHLLGKINHLTRKNAPAGEIAFVTETMPERAIVEKLKKLSELGVAIENTIRIGEL